MTVKSTAAVRILPSFAPLICLTSSSEGRALAARLRGRHIETSAKTRVNVDAAFIDLVKLIRSYQKVRHCIVHPPSRTYTGAIGAISNQTTYKDVSHARAASGIERHTWQGSRVWMHYCLTCLVSFFAFSFPFHDLEFSVPKRNYFVCVSPLQRSLGSEMEIDVNDLVLLDMYL
jgi:hypothetical protein